MEYSVGVGVYWSKPITLAADLSLQLDHPFYLIVFHQAIAVLLIQVVNKYFSFEIELNKHGPVSVPEHCFHSSVLLAVLLIL